MRVVNLLRLWFGFEQRVTRRVYFLSGVGLMALKLAVELSLVRAVNGVWLSPLDYLNPVFTMRDEAAGGLSTGLAVALVAWSIPFLWIGLSMTARRAVDAGDSPWLVVWFFCPYLNYLVMFMLAAFPSRPPREGRDVVDELRTGFRRVAVALFAGAGIVVFFTTFSVFVLGGYGTTLFLATPFVVGVVAGWVGNLDEARGVGATIGLACCAVAVGGLALLLFALEGALCIAMVMPLALAAAIPGALIGRAAALQSGQSRGDVAALLLALPLMGAAESASARTPERTVTSTIEIDAPPEVVWRHVVGFSELPPPERLCFRAGIAYPVRARIEGRGVGAVRRCEFSTGAFVEPITAWEPPRRLAFDVTENPPSMQELSPWDEVHAPHLQDFMRSKRGAFRLVPLAGGRTRLEGTTWYELEIFPGAYWSVFADVLVGAIHDRVLEHVARLSTARGR